MSGFCSRCPTLLGACRHLPLSPLDVTWKVLRALVAALGHDLAVGWFRVPRFRKTKDIRSLITNSAIQVKEGIDLVNFAGSTLEEVVASVQKITEVVSAIAQASAGQSTGIDLINRALTQMDEVTQQNSALVEENAATAKTLEHQAAQMDGRVSLLHHNTADEEAAAVEVPSKASRRTETLSEYEERRTGTHG